MREKVYFGSKGGEYVVRFGKKVYLSSFGARGNPTQTQLRQQGSNRKEREIYATPLAKQLVETQRQLTNCIAQLNTSRRQTRAVTQERNNCREQLAEMRRPPRYSSAAAGPSTNPAPVWTPAQLAALERDLADPNYEPPVYRFGSRRR
jgi:hypothetical protein